MKLLTDLFTTDYGLMSIIGIVFMMGMALFFLRLFMGKVNEGAPKAPSQSQSLPKNASAPTRR